MRVSVIALVALVVVASCGRHDEITALAQALLDAKQSGRELPVLSLAHPELTPDEAYAIQRRLVAGLLEHDRILGFKAALTSPAARARLRSDEPVLGVLFASGRLAPGARVAQAALPGLLIETELGYTLRERIAAPVPDLAALAALVDSVMLIVELPAVAFEPSDGVLVTDFIAANAASARVVVGAATVAPGTALDSLSVFLEQNGEVVSRGHGADALGDARAALLWTVNAAVAQGYVIEPGHIVITGALGRVTPGSAGRYAAGIAGGGRIAFAIE